MNESVPAPHRQVYVHRHLQFGWWSLLCFLTLGIGLEALHAFKIDWYLNESYETRQLMWRLGHAHGTLLGLVHIAFAASVFVLPAVMTRTRRLASPLLMGASILLPGGFFLGGIFIYGGDPGIGVWLAPVGALFLFLAVLLIAYCLVVHDDLGDVEQSGAKSSAKKKRGG